MSQSNNYAKAVSNFAIQTPQLHERRIRIMLVALELILTYLIWLINLAKTLFRHLCSLQIKLKCEIMDQLILGQQFDVYA